GIFTFGLAKNPFSTPSFATAAIEPSLRACFRPLVASLLVRSAIPPAAATPASKNAKQARNRRTIWPPRLWNRRRSGQVTPQALLGGLGCSAVKSRSTEPPLRAPAGRRDRRPAPAARTRRARTPTLPPCARIRRRPRVPRSALPADGGRSAAGIARWSACP